MTANMWMVFISLENGTEFAVNSNDRTDSAQAHISDSM